AGQLGLHALVAQQQRIQGRLQDALVSAQIGVARDPMNRFERQELGEVYYAMSDYGRAARSFEEALLWDPNRPDLRFSAGRAHLNLARGAAAGEREQELELARDFFTQALELSRPESGGRGRARYWLGLIAIER